MLRPTQRDIRVLRAVSVATPTVRELCAMLGYSSPGTASKALARLRRGGLLERDASVRVRVYRPTQRAKAVLERQRAGEP